MIYYGRNSSKISARHEMLVVELSKTKIKVSDSHIRLWVAWYKLTPELYNVLELEAYIFMFLSGLSVVFTNLVYWPTEILPSH